MTHPQPVAHPGVPVPAGDAPPLISVVIPTLNRPELLLQRALRSALGQTGVRLEVLVVMDGPDPRTAAALVDVQDKRVRTVPLAVNGGPSHARNVGVQAARGEWIAFLDDDDEWHPDKLARQLCTAQRSPYPLPVVFSSWITRTPQGDTLNPRHLKRPTERLGDYLLVRHSPSRPESGLTCSMIFAPRALLLQQPFLNLVRKHEDWDWMLRAEQVPGVGFEQVPPDDAAALAVYHFAEDRPFASQFTAWAPSLEWALEHHREGRLSRRALAGFIISQLAPFPAATHDRTAFRALTQALWATGPNVYELMRYLKLWAIPAPWRRDLKRVALNLRRAVSRRSPSTPSPRSRFTPR